MVKRLEEKIYPTDFGMYNKTINITHSILKQICVLYYMLRKATNADLFGIDKITTSHDKPFNLRPNKLQPEYGQKKFIKP